LAAEGHRHNKLKAVTATAAEMVMAAAMVTATVTIIN